MAQALDSLAWAYVGISIAWTVSLVCAMLFLFRHRHLPCIRMRRLPLLFIGIIPLHLYGTICILAYIIAPVLPCNAEFWVMRYAILDLVAVNVC